MKQVRLFTKSYCPYCKKAKELLNEAGIPFEDTDVLEHPEIQEELIEQTGQDTVPYVFVEDRLIGGCSDLQALMDSGKFSKLIA